MRASPPGAVVAEAFRRHADADDPAVFITLRAQAAALAPLDLDFDPPWGLPLAVKDNIDAGGLPTAAACPAFACPATDDACIVARLRAAGATVIGKTNLYQFATGPVGVRSPVGVPRHAIDPAIEPGGSSSGSAVAAARGIVASALGTDTAGSGRVPAALDNIVGLKPSLGARSASGMVPACRTLGTVSVFALTLPDAWAACELACECDTADAFSRRIVAPPARRRPRLPCRTGGGCRRAHHHRIRRLARLAFGSRSVRDLTPGGDVGGEESVPGPGL